MTNQAEEIKKNIERIQHEAEIEVQLEEMKICTACNGEGEIEHHTNKPLDYVPTTRCTICNGRGVV